MTRLLDREPTPVLDGWLADTRIPLSAGLDPEIVSRQIMWQRTDDETIMYIASDREAIEDILRTVVAPIDVEVVAEEEDEDDGPVQSVMEVEEGPVSFPLSLRWQQVNQPLIRFAQVMATATGVRMRFLEHHSTVQVPEENEILIVSHGHVENGLLRNEPMPEQVTLSFDGMQFPAFSAHGILQPSRGGIIVEDDNGFAVAEVAHRKVGLLLDFSRMNSAVVMGARVWMPMLAEKLLSRAIDIALDENKCKTAQEEALSQRVKRQRNAYVNLVSARYNVAMNDTQRQLTEAARTKANLWEQYVAIERSLGDLEVRMESFSQNGSADDAAKAEFEKLCTIPEVIDLEIGPDFLRFDTSLIVCTDPVNNKRYAIGEFQITLNMNGNTKFHNKTNAKKGRSSTWDHPHVRGGQPCFGNITKMVASYLAKLEFGAVMQMIIMYLQTVNSGDDYGKNIQYWNSDIIKDRKGLAK